MHVFFVVAFLLTETVNLKGFYNVNDSLLDMTKGKMIHVICVVAVC